ncbi:MAG: hypothetical protein IPJ15_08275 [Actinomycetales bacterium]|nr:hypothetical protein [Candidatus Phosphoribacter baldrii]
MSGGRTHAPPDPLGPEGAADVAGAAVGAAGGALGGAAGGIPDPAASPARTFGSRKANPGASTAVGASEEAGTQPLADAHAGKAAGSVGGWVPGSASGEFPTGGTGLAGSTFAAGCIGSLVSGPDVVVDAVRAGAGRAGSGTRTSAPWSRVSRLPAVSPARTDTVGGVATAAYGSSTTSVWA